MLCMTKTQFVRNHFQYYHNNRFWFEMVLKVVLSRVGKWQLFLEELLFDLFHAVCLPRTNFQTVLHANDWPNFRSKLWKMMHLRNIQESLKLVFDIDHLWTLPLECIFIALMIMISEDGQSISYSYSLLDGNRT